MPPRPARRRVRVAALLGLAAVLLVVGLSLPTLHVEKVFSGEAHSILGGVWQLLSGGRPFLGLLILFFSVVFPAVKLLLLARLWLRDAGAAERELSVLVLLGKWSMLDVWVVALFVGTVRLGLLAEFRAEPGIFVFAAGILLTMVCAHLVARDLGIRVRLRRDAERGGRLLALLSLVDLSCFAAGLSLPLMRVEKWALWSSERSLLEALGTLREEEHLALTVLVAGFVVVLPLVQLAGIVAVRWVPALPTRVVRGVLVLGEWAMLDVFAVALLVVLAQVASLASIEPRWGLALLLAAALGGGIDTWLLRRRMLTRTREPRTAS